MDSLRYFVVECHVDGFRFDLASALAREFYEVDRLSAFFDIIHQDPILSQVKLIAEPWDVGAGRLPGRQLPGPLDRVERDLPRRDARLLARPGAASATSRPASPARPISTSSDGRRPFASINFITAHDGFTLARPRLVQRQAQRGERRGATATAPTTTARGTAAPRGRPTTRRSSRSASGSSGTSSRRCFLSQGVPMLLGGDELGRTQRGNNNAYCQDNELSWFDWDRRDRRRLLEFTRRADRGSGTTHPVFRRRDVLRRRRRRAGCRTSGGSGPTAGKMTRRDWAAGRRAALGVFLNGDEIATRTPHGRAGDRRLVPPPLQRALRGRWHSGSRRAASARGWDVELSTAEPDAPERSRRREAACPSSRARSRCSGVSERRATGRRSVPPTGSSSAPELGFRERARARAVPARPRDLAPLPVAVAAGARAARPTATTSSTRGASRTTSAARTPFASSAPAGLGVILDIVPNHMAAVDENAFWRDPELREKFFDVDRAHRLPPPLLRHRRARPACAVEDPEVFEATHAQGARARRARASSTACASTIPTASPTPRGYLGGLRDAGVEHVWVEKILEPGEELRDWPVEGTTGYEFLNDVEALFVDPGAERAARRSTGARPASARSLRRHRGRGQARAGA